MFLITMQEVREQDGEAKFFLFPEDIDFLATCAIGRQRLLEALGETAIIVSTVTCSDIKKINLEEYLECGSGIHSKL